MTVFFYLRTISLLFLIITSNITYSQETLTKQRISDSLTSLRKQVSILKDAKDLTNDSLRLELMNKMALLYMRINKDTALYLVETATKEAKSLRLENMTAVSHYTAGTIHEHYKEFEEADKQYLEWMKVRKNRNDDQYRWALQKMRRFYCDTHQDKKLEKIEEEWLALLDRQLSQGYVSPWLHWENPSPQQSYIYSMKPVLHELVEHQYYFIAERSFKHIIKKCPGCYDDWNNADNFYIQVESQMVDKQDTAMLAEWYEHWFDMMKESGMEKKMMFETINRISQGYTSGFSDQVQLFDRFYPLMMSYAERIDGLAGVYRLNKNASIRYFTSLPVKIKINLYFLESCIKTGDKATMEKIYTKTEKLIDEYLSGENKKTDLRIILQAAKNRSGDKRYINWCDEKIKRLR